MEESQGPGTKRKNNDPDETGDNKPMSVPLKKAKTIKEAPSAILRKKPASATPHQKPTAPSAASSSNTNKNSKKCSSLTDDAFLEDPRTPVPLLKKPRVNKNDTVHKENSKKPQAICQTGNVSFDLTCQYVENHSTRNIDI